MLKKEVLERLYRLTQNLFSVPGMSSPHAPPRTEYDDALNQLVAERLETRGSWYSGPPPKDLPTGRKLLNTPKDEQPGIVLATLLRLTNGDFYRGGSTNDPEYRRLLTTKAILSELAKNLLRRKLPWRSDQVGPLVEVALAIHQQSEYILPLGSIVRVVEQADPEHPPELTRALQRLRSYLDSPYSDAERRKLLSRLKELDHRHAGEERLPIHGADAWSLCLRAHLDGMGADEQETWKPLLGHASTARSARPSKTWAKKALGFIQGVGRENYSHIVRACFEKVGEPGAETHRTGFSGIADPTLLDERDDNLLRGLLWGCAPILDDKLLQSVGQTAEATYYKIPGHGPRSKKIGNACFETLVHAGTLEAVSELSRLKARIRHPTAVPRIEKALATAGKNLGMTPDDLEELATPTFGLDSQGERHEVVGDYTAEIVISPELVLRWRKPDGKIIKSVPKAVRESSPDRVKALRKTLKDIRQMMPALKARLERLFLNPRSWTLEDWQKRYCDHPLMRTFTHRLIWRIQGNDAEWLVLHVEGAWQDAEGNTVELPEEAQVELWHPIQSPEDTVRTWRLVLEEHGITQPFKQAHREIYVLTDAERQTNTYSNRFAAHILRQHQFQALGQGRGWSYSLMGTFDSHNTPTLTLPDHEIQVEFWVECVHEGEVSDMGIFLYVATDQVRFCDPTGEPRPLEEIPPLLFSECLRDVDLFVSVASIGTDPNWQDHGPEGAHGYWNDFAFGNLGTQGQNRRDLLSRLVPRLAIADRCTIEDRFLEVRGTFHTYKIHLGSGNIRRSPNDQYLCIVPDRSKRAKKGQPVLPFEGDPLLSVILSKAFLLAADDQITDPVILEQLDR